MTQKPETYDDALNHVNTYSKPSQLKIVDMRIANLERRPLIKLITNQGLVGYGEVRDGGVKTYALMLKSRILGENPCNIDKIFRRIKQFGGHARQGGGVCGIELALWDLAGKAYGVPIYQMLGGQFRDKIRLYADCHAGETNEPQAYAEKALEVVAEGYGAVKFDVDYVSPGKYDTYNWTASAKEMTHIINLIRATREAVGYEIDLAIDCHGHLDLPSAITLAKAIEGLRLMWLEEPVPAENLDMLAEVKRASSTVICTGENQYSRWEFLQMFEKRAVDIIMPDFAKAGGIMEARRICDIADAYYIPVAPHNVSSPLGMMAACHVLATIPNFMVLEFHAREVPWWEDLCEGDKPFVKDGWMAVSNRPGLGVELNDKAARSLLWNGDTYFD